MKTRAETELSLAELEADVAALRKDMDQFFEAFEYRSEKILGEAAPEYRAYVFEQLEAIIERAGINV